MNFISLPITYREKLYKMDPYLGLLLELEKYDFDLKIKQPKKLYNALGYCNNPYELKLSESISFERKSVLHRKTLIIYLECLIKIIKLNFGIGRWFTFFGQPSFENAEQAILFFRKNKSGNIQDDLCLSRSLFAASTSKKFKEKGVIFIGVFLPSKSMHAWVIEDGIQPDLNDNIWINFQPVAAIW
jgi:hypothetical protein